MNKYVVITKVLFLKFCRLCHCTLSPGFHDAFTGLTSYDGNYSGLNFLDLMTRLGAIDNLPKAPFTMGCELAGVVEAVGEKVEGFTVGQR